MLEVRGVTKKYGDHTALKNLSFSAGDGKIVGFLGPNGAGKTTAMNIMSGFMAPSSGSVSICGVDPARDRKNALKNIGYLPENPPLYPEMTVTEYLRFAAGLKGITGRRQKEEADRLEKLTGIMREENSIIGCLSKGTKQRVAIAAALAGDPGVLLLDEPSNGLDPGQTAMFKKLLNGLKKNGTTIIVSSHILSQISAVCDEMLIINRGRLIASGTASFFEKKFSKEGEMMLRLPAERERSEKALAPLRGHCSVRYENTAPSGSSVFRIGAGKSDLCRELFDVVAQEGLYIESLAPATKTLEEIYLGMIAASEAEYEKALKRAEKNKRIMNGKGEEGEDDLL